MSKHPKDWPLWRQIVWFLWFALMPWNWKELRQAWRQHNQPLASGNYGDDGAWQVDHPRVQSAVETLIDAFRQTPDAENFLTWRGRTSAESRFEAGEWQVTVSRPGAWDPYAQAAAYKQALEDAGIPLPETGPLERGGEA